MRLIATKRCSKCGQTQSLDEFSKDKSKVDGRTSNCRECRTRSRVAHGDVIGFVPASRVWWIFEELSARLGQKQASQFCEMGYTAFREIVAHERQRLQARTVRKAIVVLRLARELGIWDPPTQTVSQSKIYNRCKQCGTDLSGYTEGCTTCWDRSRQKQRRATKKEFTVKLTSAQVIGLYGICTTIGFGYNVQFEIQSQDTSGNIIVSVTNSLMEQTQRWKLFPAGGKEQLFAGPPPTA